MYFLISTRFRAFKAWIVLLFALLTNSEALSRETENSMRDFSKLRLEGPTRPPQPPQPPMPLIPQPILNSPKDYYYKDEASEDHDVVFKPSFPDSPNSDYNDHNHNPNRRGNDNEENYNENEIYQHDSNPHQNGPQPHPSLPNRPFVGGEDDVGVGVAPNGYYSNNEELKHGGQMRKPEGGGSGGNGEDPQDVYFVPVPPTPGFLAEVEYDSQTGLLMEKGMGGLFDGDEESENEQEDDYGGQGQGSHPEDGRGGGGAGAGPEGSRGYGMHDGGGGGGPLGANSNRYNRYDYGDY